MIEHVGKEGEKVLEEISYAVYAYAASQTMSTSQTSRPQLNLDGSPDAYLDLPTNSLV